MNSNTLYSQVVSPSANSSSSAAQLERFELVDERMSSPPSASSSSQPQQPQQIVSNLLRIACRFDPTVTPNPPCMTAAKLMSPNSDFTSPSELWPYEIYDFEMNLSGSSWERLASSNNSETERSSLAQQTSGSISQNKATTQATEQNSTSPSLFSSSSSKHPRLTMEELMAGKPHRNAYFCPNEWKWLIITSFENPHRPMGERCETLPSFDSSFSSVSSSSTSTMTNTSDQQQFHFFQHYPRSVCSVNGLIRRPVSIFDEDGTPNLKSFSDRQKDMNDRAGEEEEERGEGVEEKDDRVDENLRWDCRLCFNCKRGIICSTVESSVGSVFKRSEALLMIEHAQRYNHNKINLRPEQLVYKAWHTVFIVIQNALIEGKISPISLNGKSISGRMPWDPISAKIWESVGVTRREQETMEDKTVKVPYLVLPNLNVKNQEGRCNRALWVRAFLEVSVFLKFWKIKYLPKIPVKPNWQTTNNQPVGHFTYSKLGILNDVPDRIVILAYQVQLRCFRHLQFELFDRIREVKGFRENCEELDLFIGLESSNGVIGTSEIREAWRMICGDNVIIDLSKEDFIANEFNKKIENLKDDSSEKNTLKEALKVLVQANPENAFLRVILDSSNVSNSTNLKSKEPMDINKAYATLGDVLPETEDEILIMAYQIGVKGSSANCMDPVSYIPPAVSYDLPAGLNNIGNSLLQYFFSVRELREVLLKFPDYEQDVEEELVMKEKKRVGGRVVSVPEILRSKQFASKLQGLFYEMIHTPLSAVTPERELAFLALVLSKDESPTVLPSNNQDSSASTDATLVDERPSFIGPAYNTATSSPPTVVPSSTVLGKRKSESISSDDEGEAEHGMIDDEDVKMAIDSKPTVAENRVEDSQPEVLKSMVIDLTEEPTGPPPLPPRPAKNRSLAVTDSGSHMMFGRQNDVSECMDNCLFQIQAALDESKISTSRPDGEGNIVKSLFYGKTRQSLSFENPEGKVSVKEEPFAYLLVDVAEEGRDLYDGLDRVFDESEVELGSGKAIRRIGLVDLPPILQIQLQRVQFDRRTHTVFKSNAYLKFTEYLKIDRYLEPDPNDTVAIEKRTQTIERRKQIESLRGRAGELKTYIGSDKSTASKVLRDLHHILSTSDMNSNMARSDFFKGLIEEEEMDYLEKEARSIEEEIVEINQKIKQLKEEVEQTWFTGTVEVKDEDRMEEERLDEGLGADKSDEQQHGDEPKDKMVLDERNGSEELAKSSTKKNRSAEYRLVSLFNHRGTANGGHYWAIQRQLPDKPDRWLKYNDSVVTEIDPKVEVFSETNESNSNPYWLTYVRVGEEDRFQMLNRNVI
ncbi:ubiquitin carboxyl-terminal hydrolase [Phakopsora pachyrhizi]|uniref:ubiquitinyl hydrolase 1 n=1 Tax=Phakopsora pachyrhizi TaxID=170000 RepID=A0AAV0AMN7_PHAPC|nr:ubiquitin carboxyl-terminal hydrolase [Phakopsora pachyrhizi]